MDDLAARAVSSNAACFSGLVAGSPGARRMSKPGLLALATPAAPERPLFNVAFVLSAGAVAGRYERLERFYRDAGISGWTVFVDPADEATAAVLEEQGHVLDSEPRLMGAAAADVAGGADPPLELLRDPDASAVAALNDEVYGYPGSFARGLVSLDRHHGLAVVVDGRPVSCALAHDTVGDCHITLVATLAEHRGRGYAGDLVRTLVRDGVARGCTTTTLGATKAGAPVYERLGYRDVGYLQMWERRV
jgi:ribosomal protein S18 acetylase RimI-like enzyme